MQTAFLVPAIAILAIIACGDVRTRRIPNALAVATVALGLVRITLAHDLVAAGYTLAASAAVFTAAFLLFLRGFVGGGDAKLVAAMALLIGHHNLFDFLFLMSLCGGVMALAILARDTLRPRFRRPLQPARRQLTTQVVACTAAPERSTVPYGVAIAAAGAITLVLETAAVK